MYYYTIRRLLHVSLWCSAAATQVPLNGIQPCPHRPPQRQQQLPRPLCCTPRRLLSRGVPLPGQVQLAPLGLVPPLQG